MLRLVCNRDCGGAASAGVAAPAAGAASAVKPRVTSAEATATGTSALLGRSRFGFGYPRRYHYGYGYRPRSHATSFLHGLFAGWLLSHFFGSGYGFPIFPFVLLAIVMWLAMRRRLRPRW